MAAHRNQDRSGVYLYAAEFGKRATLSFALRFLGAGATHSLTLRRILMSGN